MLSPGRWLPVAARPRVPKRSHVLILQALRPRVKTINQEPGARIWAHSWQRNNPKTGLFPGLTAKAFANPTAWAGSICGLRLKLLLLIYNPMKTWPKRSSLIEDLRFKEGIPPMKNSFENNRNSYLDFSNTVLRLYRQQQFLKIPLSSPICFPLSISFCWRKFKLFKNSFFHS